MIARSTSGWSTTAYGVAAALLMLGGCSADDTGASTPPPSPATNAGTFAPVAGRSATAGTFATGTAGTTTLPPRAGTGVAGVGPVGTAGVGPIGAAGRVGGAAGTAVGAAGSGVAGTGVAGVGAAGTGTAVAGTGAAGAGPAPTGMGPMLPAIEGTCPDLKNGTIMVAGHGSISITAGEPGKGGALLFYWHGTGGSAGEAMRTLPAAVRNEIISGGGIIASFNGNQSSGGGDCSGTGAHGKNDFKAADQIAACAVKNNGIDSRRIYTTGCSAGGLQSGCMAQSRSSYIAAAAPNSGGVVAPQAWQDKNSPAVFTMHGGSSDVVIVTFSQTSKTFDMSAKTHGSFVVNCDHGGGHCAAPAALQTAAWEFMKAHPFGFGTSPWAGGIPANIPMSCKIF